MSVRLTSAIRSLLLVTTALCAGVISAAEPFHLQEASIESIQSGIRSGATTCKQVVEGYIARAKVYNGICTKLVTSDGAKVPAALGTVRAGSPIKFPTDTLMLSKLVPEFSD